MFQKLFFLILIFISLQQITKSFEYKDVIKIVEVGKMVTDFKLMWKLGSELCKVKIMNSLVIKQFVNIKKFNEFKQLLSDKIDGEENLERKEKLEVK